MNIIKNISLKIILLVIAVLCVSPSWLFAQEGEKIIRLKGYWKFSIGDNKKWSEKKYDDSDWEKIYIPSNWEEEGFNGYDGYAWYRINFSISSNYKNADLLLKLGQIDDVDEVYLNGKYLGRTGSFPPHFNTAWQLERSYRIPADYLDFKGENSIAVRVFDSQLGGGIYAGDVGIFAIDYGMKSGMSLEGNWKFQTGDNLAWKSPKYDDKNWEELYVPRRWDYQGYSDYDGFAWYRKNFTWKNQVKENRLILLMGKIDDIDEVYFNGYLIGSTGDMISDPVSGLAWVDAYQKIRGYEIFNWMLKPNAENLIAVRVFDQQQDGGIYEGPVAIVSYDEYIKYLRSRGKKKSSFWFE